jgi:hypothetical protein
VVLIWLLLFHATEVVVVWTGIQMKLLFFNLLSSTLERIFFERNTR